MQRLTKRARVAVVIALILTSFILLACTGDPACVQRADEHPTTCVDP